MKSNYEKAKALVMKARAKAMKTGRRTAISGDQFREMFKALDVPKAVPILDMTYDEWEACGDDVPYDWSAKAIDFRGPDDEDLGRTR